MNRFFDIIAEEFKDADSFREFIKYTYYKILPYDWRPGQIWYRLKCFCWYRYTTVKPRQLDHTWYDSAGLMPYMMFEILSQFLEKECSPGHVDWEGSDHRIVYGDHYRNVNDVMWHLYHWWHKVYLIKEGHEHDTWHEFSMAHHIKNNTFDVIWNDEFDSKENEQYADELFNRARKKQIAMNVQLNENLKIIVDLIPYMWT